MAITIYGKEGCGYTRAACEDYAKRKIPYTYIDVQADPQAMKELLKHTRGKRVVPVILEAGRVQIGWNGTCGV